jgi:excinuclease UvrABC nuclease subunit
MMPAPVLTQCVAVPSQASDRIDLRGLSSGPGVFVLEDERGGTLALATTANLRRAVAARLEPIDAAEGPTRRIDYRQLARTVRAVPVGSAFEADWAYLQLARERSPGACTLALDRWQSWFIHGEADAAFPQWTKTAHPTRASGVHIGPFADKHSAARYMDILDDTFDLCRYHHILVQAPHGTACAYKEMGKCPAPCDGSVSMDHYRARVRQAIEFASTPISQYRSTLEQQLAQVEQQSHERDAGQCRTLLERTAAADKPGFALVDRLDRFRFVAVMASERVGWARLFVILGGWIEPLVDVPTDALTAQINELCQIIARFAGTTVAVRSQAARENLALVCWHLFRPAKVRKQERGRFIKLDERCNFKTLQQAVRSLGRFTDDSSPAVAEQFTEDAGVAPS